MGYTITDKLIKILDLFDSVEDRPWLMLYSENYIDKLFTRKMAKRLTNIWDGISGYYKYLIQFGFSFTSMLE